MSSLDDPESDSSDEEDSDDDMKHEWRPLCE